MYVSFGGTCRVIVTIVGNGQSDSSSNPEKIWNRKKEWRKREKKAEKKGKKMKEEKNYEKRMG